MKPSAFDRVDAVVYKVLKWISYGAIVFLALMMLLAFFNVVLEKLHKIGVPVSGIADTQNWIKYMNICVVYLGTAFVTLERGHSGLDLLTRRYPVIVQRILSGLAYFCGFVVISLITYIGYVKVLSVQITNNVKINETIATSFPQWPFGLIYVVGMGLLAFSCFWAFLRVCHGKKPAQDAVDPEAENKKLRSGEAGLEETA